MDVAELGIVTLWSPKHKNLKHHRFDNKIKRDKSNQI